MRKFLNLLLTVSLVLSSFVLPSSAAAKYELSEGPYLDFNFQQNGFLSIVWQAYGEVSSKYLYNSAEILSLADSIQRTLKHQTETTLRLSLPDGFLSSAVDEGWQELVKNYAVTDEGSENYFFYLRFRKSGEISISLDSFNWLNLKFLDFKKLAPLLKKASKSLPEEAISYRLDFGSRRLWEKKGSDEYRDLGDLFQKIMGFNSLRFSIEKDGSVVLRGKKHEVLFSYNLRRLYRFFDNVAKQLSGENELWFKVDARGHLLSSPDNTFSTVTDWKKVEQVFGVSNSILEIEPAKNNPAIFRVTRFGALEYLPGDAANSALMVGLDTYDLRDIYKIVSEALNILAIDQPYFELNFSNGDFAFRTRSTGRDLLANLYDFEKVDSEKLEKALWEIGDFFAEKAAQVEALQSTDRFVNSPYNYADFYMGEENYLSVRGLKRADIMIGDQGSFYASDFLRRQEAAKIISLGFELPLLSTATELRDLPTDNWAYPFAQNMLARGWMKNMKKDLFQGEEPVRTAEFVKMLVQGAGLKLGNGKSDLGVYNKQVKTGDKAYIEAALEKGIIALPNELSGQDTLADYKLFLEDTASSLNPGLPVEELMILPLDSNPAVVTLNDWITRSEAAYLLFRTLNLAA